MCWGASFSDTETERHMRRIHAATGYVMCPHTAVGHLAMQAFSEDQPDPFIQVTVATAHPAKFKDVVENTLGQPIGLPKELADCASETILSKDMEVSFADMRAYLIAGN